MTAASFAERLQGAALRAMLGFFGVLSLDAASGLGGFIARTIGPRLGVSRRAVRNLDIALPGLPAAEKRRIIRGMWDNLGRVTAEYAHLTRISCFGAGAPVEVLGTEHVVAGQARGRPIFIVSGHLANWEIGGIAAIQFGLDVAQVYRAANNPAVEAAMLALRRSLKVDPISKGASGARRIVAALKAGRTVMMLVDQKMNDGIAVPFFGHDAMTAPAAAELALRYDATLLPCRVERLGGARFRIRVMPPVELPRTGDRHADIRETMVRINGLLEAWIRERPEQWFWLHRRWPQS